MDDSAVCNISLTGLPLLPFRLTGHLPRPGSFRQRRLRKSNTWMEKYQNRRFKWIKPMIRPLTNCNNGKFLICQLGLGVFCESSVGMSSEPNGPTLETVSKKEKKSLGSSRSEKCSFAGEITKKQPGVFVQINMLPGCPLNKIRPNQLLWQFSHELQPSRVDYVAHQYHFHTIRGANPI